MSEELKITGKIVRKLDKIEVKTGFKQEFVIETPGQYPRLVALSAYAKTIDFLDKVVLGDNVNVSFNVESREFNEKFYTSLTAWRIDKA